MNSVAHAHCYHHGDREAVARCPQCDHFYCRECVSDYRGKALCADCLNETINPAAKTKRSITGAVWQLFVGASGLALAWFLFYLLASILLEIPHEFHEGRFLD